MSYDYESMSAEDEYLRHQDQGGDEGIDEPELEPDDDEVDNGGDEEYGDDDYDDEGEDGGDDDSGDQEQKQPKPKANQGKKGEEESNLKFDIPFIKKYYTKIRSHAKLRSLFDKLNLKAGSVVTGLCAGFDYLILLVKPKYANPNFKLDAIIEITIIDDGIAGMILDPLRSALDLAIKSPQIQAIGDSIIKAGQEAGVLPGGKLNPQSKAQPKAS